MRLISEITPSGTGLRVIGRAKGEKVHRKLHIPGTGGSLEVYRKAERYITINRERVPRLLAESRKHR